MLSREICIYVFLINSARITLNLIFITSILVERVSQCHIIMNKDHEENHMSIEIILDIILYRTLLIIRQKWKQTDINKLQLYLVIYLSDSFQTELLSSEEIDEWIEKITETLKSVIDLVIS